MSELCADARAGDRLVAHARVSNVWVDVELDAEMHGEGSLEVDASCSAATLLARWGPAGCSTERRSRRGVEPVVPSEPSALAAAVRHVLARVSSDASPISLAGRLRAAQRLQASLLRAPERARARPLALVLVHLPRLRHPLDTLRMPSLAVARLAAFMRGHGFPTEVVDLEAESVEPWGVALADVEQQAALAPDGRSPAARACLVAESGSPGWRMLVGMA